MLGKKEYIGLTVDKAVIQLARISVEGKQVKLKKLDRFTLIEKLRSDTQREQLETSEVSAFDTDEDADSIFGLEDDEVEDEADFESSIEDELDFDALEEEAEDDFAMESMDMVDESDTPQSNEILLYNILSGLGSDDLNLGLNIPAGDAIFQIIRDTDFNEVKRKDLIADLEGKLESIYGMPKSTDNYSYEIRENGALLLGSVDEESITLQLLNRARELYNGKLVINEIMPDEMILVGLTRANYDLEPEDITGIIQFGPETTRVIFMKGEEVWQVSPLINEGTNKKSVLNTIFSKVLFQLDTGEVPNLDRILLADNTMGRDAVEFFRNNFPDISVENFTFRHELLDTGELDPNSVDSFTTTIGAAWAASGFRKQHFPDISLVPAYIEDRQKFFKLEWHGVVLLFLIFLTPIVFNYFYNQNVQQINELDNNLAQINAEINQINPLVERTNQLSSDLSELSEKLVLVDTLSSGSREWSAKLGILNQAAQNTSNTWINSMSQVGEGTLIEGYTLYRNRIPSIVEEFHDATLLNVVNHEEREKTVYQFSILIKRFAASDSVYSPPTPEGIQTLINQ